MLKCTDFIITIYVHNFDWYKQADYFQYSKEDVVVIDVLSAANKLSPTFCFFSFRKQWFSDEFLSPSLFLWYQTFSVILR